MDNLAKLRSLQEENKALKNLIHETEAEMEGILKKTHEESEKVKKIIEKLPSLARTDNNDRGIQTCEPLSTVQCIYELENEIIKIKDYILQVSVENLEDSKKLERRLKKNRAMQEVQEEYKTRIGKLMNDKKKLEEQLDTQKTLKNVMLSESLYASEPGTLIRLLLSNQI